MARPNKTDKLLQRAKALTARELLILENSPYDAGGTRWKLALYRPSARKLAAEGLLDEDPTGPGYYRITELGESMLNTRKFLDKLRGVAA